MEKDFTRRSFMKHAGIGAATLSAFAMGNNIAYAKDENSVKFSETYDIIVVGSGISGTTAAIRAAELGNNVLVVEKMSMLGGSSSVSELAFSCINSPFQEKAGVKDSPELYVKDVVKVGGMYASPEHALLVGQTTRRVHDFWSERGVEFISLIRLGGHSVPRVLTTERGGIGILTALRKHISDNLPNCTMRKEVKVDDLVYNDEGRVIGVQVREGYRFDQALADDDAQNKSGITAYYKARKGVIFASGGYCRDKLLQGAEIKMLGETGSVANPGALGGTLKMLAKNSAHPVHLSLFRFSFSFPTEDVRWGMLVDIPSGKRFMNEWDGRNELGLGVLNKKVTNGSVTPLIVWDAEGANNFFDKNRNATKRIPKFDTLEEVAAYANMDVKLLKKAAADYNKMIDSGVDKEFGKDIAGLKGSAMKKAPFYATFLSPNLTYTPGGIRISLKGEVLSIIDAEPIKGLFACGEVTGGIHGKARLTAGSSPECGSFGLIAAENADKMSKV